MFGGVSILGEHFIELVVFAFEVGGVGEGDGFGEVEAVEFGFAGEGLFEVVAASVEDFSVGVGLVAVVAEVAGEGEEVGVEVAKGDVVVGDAVGVGSGGGEQRGAGRVADGLLAVGAGEEAALGGEFVDVGGDGVFGIVAAEFGAEVVDGDE